MDWFSSNFTEFLNATSLLIDEATEGVVQTTEQFLVDVGLIEQEPDPNEPRVLFNRIEETWKGTLLDQWKKKADLLSIQTDYPRLCSRISITSATGEPLVVPSESNPTIDMATSILAHLSNHLSDPFPQLILNDLSTSPLRDLNEELRLIMEKHLSVPEAESSPTVFVLKALNQQMIFPAYYVVKYRLNTGELKDKPKTWRIFITFREDGGLKFVHRKGQYMHVAGDIEDFIGEFEWELEINIGYNDSQDQQQEQTQTQEEKPQDKVDQPQEKSQITVEEQQTEKEQDNPPVTEEESQKENKIDIDEIVTQKPKLRVESMEIRFLNGTINEQKVKDPEKLKLYKQLIKLS